jgi:hypothetical protein
MHYSDETDALAKLGKFKAGKGCIYIKKLSDINQDVLAQIIANGIKGIRKRYPD